MVFYILIFKFLDRCSLFHKKLLRLLETNGPLPFHHPLKKNLTNASVLSIAAMNYGKRSNVM
jgi:hypothetical protein